MKSHNKTKICAIVILTFVVGLALWPAPRHAQNEQAASREDDSPVPIGGSFTLTDQHGHTVKEADFRGRVMLVFFGFTHCPMICPTTASTMSKVMEGLGEKADKVAPIFISVDPKRDTPERIADYFSSFDKRLVGLTGSEAAVKQAAAAYRVYFTINKKSPDDEDYMVDHSTIVYMMDEQGKYLRHFAYDEKPDVIITAINEYLK